MRCAAKEEQRQEVFFFSKSKFTFFPSDVSHVCRQGTSHREGGSFCFLLLFLRLNFLSMFSRHPFRISLSLTLFCFSFSRFLWCVLSAFPDPGLLSVQYFSVSSPLCLSLSATAQCTTRELHHSLLLPTEQDAGDFSSKTLKANATQHSSCKSPSTLKELWEGIEAFLLY